MARVTKVHLIQNNSRGFTTTPLKWKIAFFYDIFSLRINAARTAGYFLLHVAQSYIFKLLFLFIDFFLFHTFYRIRTFRVSLLERFIDGTMTFTKNQHDTASSAFYIISHSVKWIARFFEDYIIGKLFNEINENSLSALLMWMRDGDY